MSRPPWWQSPESRASDTTLRCPDTQPRLCQRVDPCSSTQSCRKSDVSQRRTTACRRWNIYRAFHVFPDQGPRREGISYRTIRLCDGMVVDMGEAAKRDRSLTPLFYRPLGLPSASARFRLLLDHEATFKAAFYDLIAKG